jgi:pimeloyl-ACP methyl ester carboxylesterase
MDLEILEAHPASGADPAAAPLLFVHGAWHGAWCWAENMLPFMAAHGRDAYALSLRGHGRSGRARSLRWTSLGDYVEDVGRAVERIGRAPVLVGHSMGGLIVQRHLAEGGAAVAGVLLAPVPLRGVLPLTLRTARRHPRAFLAANLTGRLWPIVATPALARDLLSDAFTDAQVAAVHARLQDESYLAYLGMLVPRIDASRVRVPILVIGGGADRLFPPREIQATARAYGVDAEIVPGVSHDLMLDPAWERIARRILDWVDAPTRLGAGCR